MLISMWFRPQVSTRPIDTLKENKLAFNLSSAFHGEPSPSVSVSSVFGLRQLLIEVLEKSFTLSATCDKANYQTVYFIIAR